MNAARGPRYWLAAIERGLVACLRHRGRPTPTVVEREAMGHIRALLRQPGCPICRGLAEARERSIFWFLYEGYYEEGSMRQLCAAGGFCPSHFWELPRHSGTWALSYVPQYLIENILERLRAARRSAWSKPQPTRDDCPTCSNMAWWEWNLVVQSVIALRDPDIRAAYTVSGRLCARHLRQVAADISAGSPPRSRSRAVACAASCADLQGLAELVPTPMGMDQCPMCAVELVTRRTVMQQWTADLNGLPPKWPAWEDLCALHEAWLTIEGGLHLSQVSRVFPVLPQPELATHPPAHRRLRHRAVGRACSLCALERHVTVREAHSLASRLSPPDARMAYIERPGFCVPHFDLVLSKAAPDLQGFLGDVLVPILVRTSFTPVRTYAGSPTSG
jgi:hypothetical protein